MSTYDSWMEIITSAKETIHIAEMYFTLTSGKDDESAYEGYKGNNIFEELYKAHARNVSIYIVRNMPTKSWPGNETDKLRTEGIANVQYIDWAYLSNGVLHTKFIIADKKHFYLGSANADWRSLT